MPASQAGHSGSKEDRCSHYWVFDGCFPKFPVGAFLYFTTDATMAAKKIQIKFLGSLRHDLNRPSLFWPVETKTSVRSIVNALTQDPQYQELRIFFSETLDVKRSLLIFLNDQEISALSGMDTLVEEDDTLAFIPVIHGGMSP